MAFEAAHDGPGQLIGLEWIEQGEDFARARVAVTDDLRQPAGIVHGGIYPLIAESICSRATWDALDREVAAIGQSNNTAFLRPISTGHVNVHARARHRGRTTWVWDVEITDDEERICALVRMTMALRPMDAASPGTGS